MAKKTKKSDHPHVAKLKSLGVYEKFEKNLATRSTIAGYVEYAGDRSWSDLIYAAFDWASTPEGHGFWERIANK